MIRADIIQQLKINGNSKPITKDDFDVPLSLLVYRYTMYSKGVPIWG